MKKIIRDKVEFLEPIIVHDGGFIQIPTLENGETIGIDKEVTEGSVVISIKVEPQTEDTITAGHIAIETNGQGQLFGRMTWKEII